MDANVESEFVRECIKKEYRERMQFELRSQKHRQKALSRFAHGCESILQSEYQKRKASELADLWNAASENAPCYLISDGVGDGTTLPMSQAKMLLLNACMPLVVISLRCTVIKPESEGGQPIFYVFAKGKNG